MAHTARRTQLPLIFAALFGALRVSATNYCALTGTCLYLKPEDGCQTNNQCLSGRCLGNGQSGLGGAFGTCDYSSVGQQCFDLYDCAGDDTTCEGLKAVPYLNFVYQLGTCTAPAPPPPQLTADGGACSVDSGCASGFCAGGYCRTTNLPTNSMCLFDRQCKPGSSSPAHCINVDGTNNYPQVCLPAYPDYYICYNKQSGSCASRYCNTRGTCGSLSNGQTCSLTRPAYLECTSGNCYSPDGGVTPAKCQPATGYIANGDACTYSAFCASGNCFSQTTGYTGARTCYPATGFIVNGGGCGKNADCDSGNCYTANPSEQPKCVSASGYIDNNQLCPNNAACASGNCYIAPGTPDGTQALCYPATGYIPTGYACSTSESCQSGNCYTPNAASAPAKCTKTSGYIPNGNQCPNNAACASGNCYSPNANTPAVCSANTGYIPNGNSCSTSASCQSGRCFGGLCQTPCPDLATQGADSNCYCAGANQQYDAYSNSCKCAYGMLFSRGQCVSCPASSFFVPALLSNPDRCYCTATGTLYDNASNTCACQLPYFPSPSGTCQQCPLGSSLSNTKKSCNCAVLGQQYNAATNTCNCFSGGFVNGQACKSCPSDAKPTGDQKGCICNASGKVWTGAITNTCVIPATQGARLRSRQIKSAPRRPNMVRGKDVF